MKRICLTKEKETLLIPLLARARQTETKNPILNDKKAVEIVKQINYDFESLNVPEKTNIMMSIRAKLIDDYLRRVLATDNDTVVLHLGCGLDSRRERLGERKALWFDLDFPDVIDIRRHFYQEQGTYHMIPSSVTAPEWVETIPQGKDQYVVVAEGLLMYLEESDIRELLSRLKRRIGSYTLIFDAYSTLTVKKSKNHPSLKKTGAVIKWGIDNPYELTNWDLGISLVEEKYFTDFEAICRLNTVTKAMFRLAGLFSVAKKAHRVLVYEVRGEN